MAKYLFLVPDGAADFPLDELGGKTVLEAARIPKMDMLAERGVCGTATTVPLGMPAGSDVANLSLLGYDPRVYYTGRGPLEAASLGVTAGPGEIIFRCNLITVLDDILVDYSAGHVTTGEARELMLAVERALGRPGLHFYPGMSYRHLMVIDGDYGQAACRPPHDVVGQSLREVRPTGPGSQEIVGLIQASEAVLRDHPVNQRRLAEGKNPANRIWPWGQGPMPDLPGFEDIHGKSGAMITAVDLLKGLGICAGLTIVTVPGATGYFDTDYAAKARYALESLNFADMAFVHVEASDEAGHLGDAAVKIEALENFDNLVVGTILEGLENAGGDCRVLVAPDHFTPVVLKTHVPDPVPFAIYGPGIEPDACGAFNERAARSGSYRDIDGWRLMELLFSL